MQTTLIYGKEGSGKTRLAERLAKQTSKNYGHYGFIDIDQLMKILSVEDLNSTLPIMDIFIIQNIHNTFEHMFYMKNIIEKFKSTTFILVMTANTKPSTALFNRKDFHFVECKEEQVNVLLQKTR